MNNDANQLMIQNVETRLVIRGRKYSFVSA